ncbi:MAG: 4-hydroxy-3-methylbut-2-enyl diphosphate reductase [Ignavibacteriaceae bacterium]|nr:4-hydroxy-3-methylbut-2-enyl diphosphate reductase [Ignavibacteriaceae bacterium]NUM70864.1 4-hydroxy-3-methylbut-2-enyl diphosphate reductase [Ignavibacteriaceae bacterium]
MIVSIDKSAGFCWGVVRAIDFAENELQSVSKVYCLGDIIHNTTEVKRLNELGLETVSVNDFPNLERGSKILIRAHGEPPETYAKARQFGLEIIDATCPIVTRVQERVRKFVDQDYQVVIYGKKDHAEVIGINGVTGYTAIVVKNVEDALEKVDFKKPTVLFTQTTMDKRDFKELAEALKQRCEELVVGSIEETAVQFHAKDTICGQVSGRERKLQQFASENDIIVFTAGRKSSNGKVLHDIAKAANQRTYFAETIDEIDWSWFEGVEKVGISGATSTPHWVMQQFKEVIENKFNSLVTA